MTSDVAAGSARQTAAAPKGGNTAGAARSWVEATRPARWALALALVLGSLGVFSYWLAAGTDLACQVVTVTGGAAGKVTTTSTCGLPSISDFAYVLAVVAVLLLPDAQRLRVGGFEFERLSSKLDEQTDEIAQLRQQVSNINTINIGADLLNHDRDDGNLIAQARDGFRERKDILDEVRDFLPGTPEVRERLAELDELEGRINAESWPDLVRGTLTAADLIRLAGNVAADMLVRSSEAADTAESEARAQQAESVISRYLPSRFRGERRG